MNLEDKQLLTLKVHLLAKELNYDFSFNTKYSYDELRMFIKIIEKSIINDLKRKQHGLIDLLHSNNICMSKG
ncbi:hypothetical protein ACXGQW_05520 [Wenyingzhuangia sp. IMCC45533]